MGPGGPFGRGPRIGRGGVKNSIILLLGESDRHGYEIITELESRTGGAWKPSPGAVYPTLAALEDEGLIAVTDSDGKKVYHLTESGREYLGTLSEGPAPWEAFRGGPGSSKHELMDQFKQLAIAVRQVGMGGSATEVEKTLAILADARKSIFKVLAED